jgi:ubiquinone/menaquinone biosynthesis C-methylase UbiE
MMAKPIHESASAAFTEAARAYDGARPDYPREMLDWLIAKTDLGPSKTILDLAAGTGKLTRRLVGHGARVLAVEPVGAMRARLEQALPELEVLDGSAEALPLPGAAVDVVTVAQAFHWFRGREALTEIHRVLRPGGSLALIWNVRDISQPVQAALDEIINRHRAGVPTYLDRQWQAAFEETALFTLLERRQLYWRELYDADGLVAFSASLSQIAALPHTARHAALASVRELAGRSPSRFPLRFFTEVYIYNRH